MNRTLFYKASFLGKIGAFVLLIVFAAGALAQTPKAGGTKAKPKSVASASKNKAKKPSKAPVSNSNVGVAIDTAAFNISKADGVLGSGSFNNIILKFLVKGDAPAKDVPVTLTIEDHTTVTTPQFYEASAASNTTTLSIPKASFPGLGKTDTAKIPVRLIYKSPTGEKGEAYIGISGQTTSYTKITFNPISKPNRPIILLDSNTTIQLDTFKKNASYQFPVKLYFKLAKAVGIDTTLTIDVNTVNGLKNLKLSDVTPAKPYSIKIAKADWNNKKDTVISRNLNLYLQQLTPVIDEQDLILKIEKGTEDKHIVKLMPSKQKNKVKVFSPIDLDSIEIVSGKVGISHYYSSTAEPVNSIDSINIQVRLFGEYQEGKNQFSLAFLDTNVSKHFQILENPITITKLEWENAPTDQAFIDSSKNKKALPPRIGLLKIPLHIKTINLNDSLNNAQYIDLVIQGRTQALAGSQKIKLSVKDKPFWAEVGTNFDLLDHIKTNNFYAGVYMFDKDIARIGGSKDNKNLSFTGGVYESQSVSAKATTSAGYAYRDLTTVHRDTGSVSASTTVKSIGILFSPHLKLTTGKTDENGLHVFLSFYSELLWQTVSSNFTYPKAPADNIVPASSLPMDISNYPYKENTISFDFRSHYQGFGLPIYIKEREFNLYVNDVLGLSSQQFYVNNLNQNSESKQTDPLIHNYVTDLTFLKPNNRWNPFFLFQFRLNEVKYGLTFGGEIRELLLQNAKPIVTLSLSKKFDLSEVLKPLIGKFN